MEANVTRLAYLLNGIAEGKTIEQKRLFFWQEIESPMFSDDLYNYRVKKEDKREVVYLAGRVTGLPRWYVVLKFWFFKSYLQLLGYKVCNPLKIVKPDTEYHEAMDICLKNLRKCQCIYIMPDWYLSYGSMKEMKEAAKKDLKLINKGYKIKGVYHMLRIPL